MKWAQKQKGFTIVELLIVVVVIAILAAITIVAYNGIQNRAKDSAAKNTASQAAKKLSVFATTTNNSYPTDEADFLLQTQLSESNTVSYQYRSTNSNAGYCLTTTVQGISYFTSDSNITPTIGACLGHGVNGGGTITNLATNPSSEVSMISVTTGGGGTAIRTTADQYSGSASTVLTKGTGWAYLRGGGASSYGIGGEVISFSTWVKSSSSPVLLVRRGAGVPYAAATKTVPLNTWVRIVETYTIPAGATSFFVDVGWEAATAASGATLYVDATMVTSGSTLNTFADGNSPGWFWNLATDESTSTGPAL